MREKANLQDIAQRKVSPKEAGKLSAEFFTRFEEHFDKAPIQEKKALLRQVVLGVRVDPERRVARCAVTKIPMVTPAMQELVNPSGLVGTHCSGDPKYHSTVT